jgi:DNA-directed RNA polymerase specialized sigma24 family protein
MSSENYRGASQTGGSKKTWVFDPASVEDIGAIRDALVASSAEDEFFAEDQGMTTLAIVMDKILDDLPTDLAEAVSLVYLKGQTFRGAAKILGVTHKTVKARVEKGVAMMRKRLTDSVWVAEMLRGYIPADENDANKVEGFAVRGIIKSLGGEDEQK